MFEIFHTLLIQWDDWSLWIWGICQWRSDLAGTTEGHWAGTQTLNVLPLQSRGSYFLYSTLTLWADQWGPFPPQTQTGTFLLFTLYSVCTVTKPEGHWGNRAPNKSCQITLSRASKVVVANWRLLWAVVGKGDWILPSELIWTLHEPVI